LPELLDTPAGLLTPVRLAIAVLIANSIVAGLAEIPKAVLGGENQGYRRMGLSALVVVVTASLTAAAIGADAGIFGVALAAATGTLLNMALFVGIAKRHIPWFGMKRPSGEALRWFGSKSVGFFLWKWINQFLMQGDVLLIGIFGSPTMVTVYSLSKHVPDALGRLTGFAVSGSAAGFGRLVAEHRLTKVRRVRGELMIATWLLVVVCGSVALVWTPSFVRLWVGAGFETEPATLVLILALAGQLMFIRTDSTIIDSTLNLGRKLALGAISVAVTVALVSLIPHQERTLSTFCIALLVGRLPVSLGYAYIVGQVTEHPVHEQAMAIARPAAVGVVLLAAAANLQELAVATGWLPLAASVVLTLLLASLVALPAGLNSIQRERLLGRLRALI
jgi:O-antigen/teichoic acid export membrane protein